MERGIHQYDQLAHHSFQFIFTSKHSIEPQKSVASAITFTIILASSLRAEYDDLEAI